MPDEPDEMNTPVTRAELREELSATRAELREELSATRAELRADIASSAATTRAELRADIASSAATTRAELRADIASSAAELRAELASKSDLASLRAAMYSDVAHLFRSFEEEIIGRMRTMLEPQKDHEPRIKALEAAVFAPSPPRKRRRGA